MLLLQQEVLRRESDSTTLHLAPLPLPFSQPTTRPLGALSFVSANASANHRSDWMDCRPVRSFFPSPDELAAAGCLLTYCNNQYVVL